MRIYGDLTELVGNTPLVRVSRFCKERGAQPFVVKLEKYNPLSSAKDRPAVWMLNAAEKEGLIKPGSVILEPSSGNTGLGLAMVAAIRGYRFVITMPDSMSIERREMLAALGVEIVLTPGELGMPGAVEKAEELALEHPDWYMPRQFENQNNFKAHYETTGPEIIRDTDGKVDIYIAMVATGGTLGGTAQALREHNPNVEIIAVNPEEPHLIQGVGQSDNSTLLKQTQVDETIVVTDADAFQAAKDLARTEGLLVGMSGGGCAHVASVVAKRPENKDKLIVALIPDTGERYLSTELFK